MEVKETVRKYDKREHYTYADYAKWDDDRRWELIDGEAYAMSAPSAMHQSMLVELGRQFANFLVGKQCKVFVAPFDVCLNAKGDKDDTVVQPDLVVICDRSKLNEKWYNGAPDLIIEITSPSSSRTDRIKKLNKYLQAGVREYWIADPEGKGVTVHILDNGKYIVSAYDETESISVNVLEDCIINLTDVFAAPL